MSRFRALLLDVFETVLTVDFDAVLDGLAAESGLGRQHWVEGERTHSEDLMTGAVTPQDAFTAIFGLAGQPARDIDGLLRHHSALLQQHATLYPDVLPLVDAARSRGLAVAFVSNCAPNAGPLLEALGLASVADHVVLSCAVGSAKPDPGIYLSALDALQVQARHALFVDDQASYCAGAEDLGITAVRIDRCGRADGAVRSLSEILPML